MTTNNKRKNRWIIVSIILLIICLMQTTLLGILYVKKLTPQKLLSKVGIKVNDATDYSLLSWNSSLEQLVYDADIVFIGDSLTRGENFQEYFPDSKIINLGRSGDTVYGVSERSYLISHFTPEKVFVMCGVNSLKTNSIEDIISQYESMIIKLMNENPNSEFYVQSVLPIQNNKQEGNLTNENIVKLNYELQKMADRLNVTYIDVYSAYEQNGELNPKYTVDGIHLQEDYKYLWLDLLTEYLR